MRRFLRYLLYGGSFKLRFYEQACIDQFKSALSPEAVLILNKQLKHLDYIQRYMGSKMVVFYSFNDTKFQSWPTTLSFPIGGEERRVFRIKMIGNNKKLKAEIVLYNGRLSSIEFNLPPKILKDGFEVVESKVLLDPMIQNIETSTRTINYTDFPGWIQEIVRETSVTIKDALPLQYREKLNRQIDAALPADYLKIIEQFENIDTYDFVIHGFSSVWHLPRPDNDYIILADIKTKGSIGVMQGNQDTVLYYIDNETDDIENLGTSLIQAIKQKLSQNEDS